MVKIALPAMLFVLSACSSGNASDDAAEPTNRLTGDMISPNDFENKSYNVPGTEWVYSAEGYAKYLCEQTTEWEPDANMYFEGSARYLGGGRFSVEVIKKVHGLDTTFGQKFCTVNVETEKVEAKSSDPL